MISKTWYSFQDMWLFHNGPNTIADKSGIVLLLVANKLHKRYQCYTYTHTHSRSNMLLRIVFAKINGSQNTPKQRVKKSKKNHKIKHTTGHIRKITILAILGLDIQTYFVVLMRHMGKKVQNDKS